MARRPRLEIEGGLYHVITRGNDRRPIFHSKEDHARFLSLLTTQKGRLPFYLYAYCMMTNHIHLLIERKADMIGQIMHRVLTGYTQYYNRRYKKVGHLLQGRHKAILCQSELYLGELVRYIHLNPVRAKMVESVEEYPYSSHRAYLGIEPAGIVDIDPVLRLFGSKREEARRHFAVYTGEAKKLGSREDLYNTEKGILGSSEFVDATIHRLGDTGFVPKPTDGRRNLPLVDLDTESLLLSVEQVAGISREDFCHAGKSARAVAAKEALIVSGRRLGGTTTILAAITGLNSANISRRHDSGLMRISSDPKFNEMVKCVIANYEESRHKESRESQA